MKTHTFAILIIILFIHFTPLSIYASEDNFHIFRFNNNLNGYTDTSFSGKPQFKWRKQLPAIVSAAPVSDGKNILTSCSDNTVYCLKPEDGNINWQYKLPAESQASITIFQNSAIVCTTDNKVLSLAIDTGKLQWQKEIGGKVAGAANIFKDKNDIRILLGSYDHNVYCLNFANGDIHWQVAADNYINSSVSISGELAAVGSCDGFMYFIDITTGKISGKFDTGAYIPGWPIIDNDICYCGNYAGDFYAIDVKTQKSLWNFKLEDGIIMKGPACGTANIVFADEDGKLFCLDKVTGLVKWQFKADDKVLTAPAINTDSVFCCSENGWVYILDLADGKIKWKYLVGEDMTEPIYISGKTLLFTDNSGRVYCFAFAE